MQNAFVKKRIGAVIGTLTFLVLIALFVCLPNTSYGATVGSEKPNIMTVMNCLPVLTM